MRSAMATTRRAWTSCILQQRLQADYDFIVSHQVLGMELQQVQLNSGVSVELSCHVLDHHSFQWNALLWGFCQVCCSAGLLWLQVMQKSEDAVDRSDIAWQRHEVNHKPQSNGGGCACAPHACKGRGNLRRVMDMRRAVTGGTQCCATSAPFPFSTRQDPAWNHCNLMQYGPIT